MRRTKIVCTLGPAVDSPSVLADLVHSGMDVARINFSHGTHEDHGRRIAAVRAASRAAGRPVAVLQDLCGPKIRIGAVASGRILVSGESLVFGLGPVLEPDWVPLPIPEIFRAACPGDRMLLDDGLIEVVVESAEDDRIDCRVVTGGPLGSRKGICLPGVGLEIEALTAKDREDAAFGRAVGVDFVAVSFVRSAADLELARSVVGPGVPLLAKIEKAEAVARIESILDVADGVMVARGDLGVEMPLEQIAVVQKDVIRAANRRGKPVITATQMLDSMIERPRPTRAEVTDIANAVLDGTDALMLSGETAVGKWPVESVRTMVRVVGATESRIDYDQLFREKSALHGRESVTDAVAEAAVTIAQDQGAAAIVCGTATGGTARSVAKFRPSSPILAATDDESTVRRLCMVRGVMPVLVAPIRDTDSLLRSAAQVAEQSGLAPVGSTVVITAGTPVGEPGSTNLIKVHEIGNPL